MNSISLKITDLHVLEVANYGGRIGVCENLLKSTCQQLVNGGGLWL